MKQTTIDFPNSLIVGVDVHKRQHTAVLVNPFNQMLEKITFDNEDKDIEGFIARCCQIAQEKVKHLIFALEDTNGNGEKLSHLLYQQGFSVFAVPSHYTQKERLTSPHLDKTDAADARRVAEVMLLKSDKLPCLMVTKRTKKAKQIKEVGVDRAQIVKQQTMLKNQLHKLLHQLFGNDYEKQTGYKDLFCPSAISIWLDKLVAGQGNLAKRTTIKLRQLALVQEEVALLTKRLETLARKNEDARLLKTIPGCGWTTAAQIAAEIGDIRQFSSSAALAKYAGIAPRAHSSGGRVRHYTDFRGNRALNQAFYTIALAQIGNNGYTKGTQYYRKKLKEGKTKLHALRCLKRQLVKVVYQMLKHQRKYRD